MPNAQAVTIEMSHTPGDTVVRMRDCSATVATATARL
jgi:hypothetical protein